MADNEAAGDEVLGTPGGSPRRAGRLVGEPVAGRLRRIGRRGAPGQAFGGRSQWADVGGPVHYLDFGGPARAPAIVAVHGLGGSSVNWAAIAPRLTIHYRLIAPDLGGFGLTRAGSRDVSVPGNRDLLHRFLETVPAVARKPVILMGNSMGGMISMLEASAAPPGVAALILVDPALPFAFARPDPLVATVLLLFATPGLGGLMRGLRRSEPPEVRVARLLSLCCADAARVPEAMVAKHVELERRRTEFPDREQAFNDAMRSLVYTVSRRGGQAYRAITDSVGCPVLLLHGDRDRLVPVAVARAAARAHPGWTYTELPGVGHVPQLEVPDETARLVLDWLARLSAGPSTGHRARRMWGRSSPAALT
ncbi:MAG: alpha/beta hydrolase [Trebonia sp.]|jgi:pimeloyl-ACP methyl ester carboxylesterase